MSGITNEEIAAGRLRQEAWTQVGRAIDASITALRDADGYRATVVGGAEWKRLSAMQEAVEEAKWAEATPDEEALAVAAVREFGTPETKRVLGIESEAQTAPPQSPSELLVAAIASIEDGSCIIVSSQAMAELGEQARRRMCPDKQVTFVVRADPEPHPAAALHNAALAAKARTAGTTPDFPTAAVLTPEQSELCRFTANLPCIVGMSSERIQELVSTPPAHMSDLMWTQWQVVTFVLMKRLAAAEAKAKVAIQRDACAEELLAVCEQAVTNLQNCAVFSGEWVERLEMAVLAARAAGIGNDDGGERRQANDERNN
jgi:hypothetical protein